MKAVGIREIKNRSTELALQRLVDTLRDQHTHWAVLEIDRAVLSGSDQLFGAGRLSSSFRRFMACIAWRDV